MSEPIANKSVDKDGAGDAEPILTHKTPVYKLCSFGALMLCKVFHRLRVEGLENIPKEGGAVLASNHQSYLDILIIGGCSPRHVAFVGRDTLGDWRWLRYVMQQCGAVFVKRGTGDRKALKAMAEHLKLGDTVAIYPEGTRTLDGSLLEFKGGAVLAARLADVPIVPVGIRGAVEAWPKGRWIPFPKKIGIRFGPPIDSRAPDVQERLVAAVQAMVGDGTYRSVPPI